MEKQNRTRNIQLLFRVTQEEKDLIYEKMRLADMNNFRAYALAMAVKGYIVNTDYGVLKNHAAELQKITVNIYQILRHINPADAALVSDAGEIREKLNDIWRMERRLLNEFKRY